MGIACLERLQVVAHMAFEIRHHDTMYPSATEHAPDIGEKRRNRLTVDVLEDVRVIDRVDRPVPGRNALAEIVDADVALHCAKMLQAVAPEDQRGKLVWKSAMQPSVNREVDVDRVGTRASSAA